MTADRQRSCSGKPLAHFAARLRRLPLIEIERRRPIEMRHLAGMMKDVAEQDRRLAAALDRDAHMCGTMPRRRNEMDFRTQSMIAVDEIDEARLDNGFDRIRIMRRDVLVIAMGAPMLVFLAAPDIARIRKCRHPSPLQETRVPADMIDMQMRTYDGVDRVRCETA